MSLLFSPSSWTSVPTFLQHSSVERHCRTADRTTAGAVPTIVVHRMVVAVVGCHDMVLLLRRVWEHVRRHCSLLLANSTIGDHRWRRRRLGLVVTRRRSYCGWITTRARNSRPYTARTEDTALVRDRQLEVLVRALPRIKADTRVGDPAALATGRWSRGDVDRRLGSAARCRLA